MRVSEKRRKEIIVSRAGDATLPTFRESAAMAEDLGECREWIRKTVSSQRTAAIDYAEGRALVEEKPERLSNKVVDICERNPASADADTISALAREVKAVREIARELSREREVGLSLTRLERRLREVVGREE